MEEAQFKENRQLIKKRLSDKQRLPFEHLVDRHIHYGLSDELREQKPFDDSKILLELNRKLSHRPQPSDIVNDDAFPNDLKKADSEYYKLYEYRDCADDKSKITEIIKPESQISHGTIDNPLDWKFGQRSSVKDLEIRGIIPEQYVEVAHGDKSLDDAQKEWAEYRNQSRQKLTMKLKQRMDPNEADQRAIINKEQLFSNKDYDEHFRDKKDAIKQLKLKMTDSLMQRSDKTEIIFRGIVPKEYLDEDVNVAKSKLRQQRVSVKQTMNKAFGNRPSKDQILGRYSKDDLDVSGHGQNESSYETSVVSDLKRQIMELKTQNENYANQIAKYESGDNTHEFKMESLKQRIRILEENEIKYNRKINEMMQSKYKLVVATASEIDALRFRIKMYTRGNWKNLISDRSSTQ